MWPFAQQFGRAAEVKRRIDHGEPAIARSARAAKTFDDLIGLQ
jgi:hypothetical protein